MFNMGWCRCTPKLPSCYQSPLDGLGCFAASGLVRYRVTDRADVRLDRIGRVLYAVSRVDSRDSLLYADWYPISLQTYGKNSWITSHSEVEQRTGKCWKKNAAAETRNHLTLSRRDFAALARKIATGTTLKSCPDTRLPTPPSFLLDMP
jgi:predicted metal-dependent phosphoesterase TrpH